MISSILKLLGSALSIWEHKEKNKYFDRYVKLENKYYEEYQKDKPDHSTLDNIERELLLLVDRVSSEIKGS